MKNVFFGFAIAACLMALANSAAKAAEWGQLYGYVDWTSDYRFYGASESNRQPAVQGGLHWVIPDNYYAGVFVTGVDFKDYRNTSYEVDFYGGRHFYFNNNDLNLELLYSTFPDTAGHPTYTAPGVIYPTYNFFEGSAELTYAFGALALGAKIILEPASGSRIGMLWSLNGAASYAINDWLKASANMGRQWVDHGTQTHWDVGATATWRLQWALDVRYHGTDISRTNCYFTNWCEPTVAAKITYSFDIL